MLRKIQLDQTRKYELAIATYELSKMLVDYLEGREHHLSLGSEQGDINTWDDFIIENFNGSYRHVQIKRQETDFSKDQCKRDTYQQGDRKGKLRDLSPFDKSMNELAIWLVNNDPATATPPREFIFEMPDVSIEIKAGYEVRHFNSLCDISVKSATTAANMRTLANSDQAVANGFEWLTSWCGFNDWDHILKGLKYLRVTQTGDELDIFSRSETQLSRCFNNPGSVIKLIRDYIDDDSNFPNKVTPRGLLVTLQSYLRVEIHRWTQFGKAGSAWNISGTHDPAAIEEAVAVVKGIWSKDFNSYLKMDAEPSFHSQNLVKAIIRLALHFKNSGAFHVPNKEYWFQQALSHVGGTLGIDDEDCESLPFFEYKAFKSADTRQLDTLTSQDLEAAQLTLEMHRSTYEKVKLLLEDKFVAQMPASELRTAVELKWKEWKAILEAKEPEQIDFFIRMLHPNAEGSDIIAESRVGIQTSKLIAKGIFYFLVVSVALNLDNDVFYDNGKTNVKALSWWSGPQGHPRKPRELTDPGITELLGKEPAEILILSGSGSSNAEILRQSLGTSSEDDQETMATPHKPKYVLTASSTFRTLIYNGSIVNIKNFINEEIDKRDKAIDEQINKIK